MPRNFYRRIEAVFPIEEPELRDRVIGVLQTLLKDNRNAQLLRANGAYDMASKSRKAAQPVAAQDVFLVSAEEAAQRQAKELQEEQIEAAELQKRLENTPQA
jgi:Polyphosphate kinase